MKEGFKIIGRKDLIYEILQPTNKARKNVLSFKGKDKDKDKDKGNKHFTGSGVILTLSILQRIRRQSELSVRKALDCRNVIQVIQDGKDIIYSKGG